MQDFERTKALFDQVVQLPPDRRDEFLETACGHTPEVRDQVLRMLHIFTSSTTQETFKPPICNVHTTSSHTGDFRGTDRFVVHRRLGSGAFGSVYEVWDREQHVALAAKALHTKDPDVLLHFKREFRTAAGLRHENLVRLHELISKGDQWFFTMELIHGEDFLTYVRPNRACCFDRLRPALYQLVRGVCALHAAKHLHRDLKPSNVLVTHSGRVVLLDFGLIRDITDSAHADHSFGGTPAYMSPEQAGRMALSEASDWYSVGVMLFEALTGRLPPASALERLMTAVRSDFVEVEDLTGAPDDLRQLCIHLLRLRPDGRPSGPDILQTLAHDHDREPVDQSDPTDTSAYERDIFVGRNEQMQALQAAFAEMQASALRVVLVQGPSGVGKTTTVRTFLESLVIRQPDVIILKGRCYEFESVPYKGLDALIDDLARYLNRLPAAELNALLPRDAFLLPRSFPVLARVASIARTPVRSAVVLDAQELRYRTFAALRELLSRLSQRYSLVVWIDDVQWQDRDSSTFLAELCTPPTQPPLLLLLTYRTEDLRSNSTLQHLHDALTAQPLTGGWREITLGPLTDDESLILLDAVLSGRNDVSADMRNIILKEGGGHPLFLQQLSVALTSRDHWPISMEIGDFELRRVLQNRIVQLPSVARDVLEYICLASQPLAPRVFLLCSESESAGAEDRAETIHLLVYERLARISGVDHERRVEPFHDQIRTAVLDMLTPDVRQRRHARLADVLSEQPEIEPQALVTHYQEAGDLAAAHNLAVKAAELSEEQLAFDRAAVFYQIALNTNPEQGPTLDLHRRLADVLGKAGRGYEAAHAYLKAATLRAARQSELKRLAADQLMRSGHVDEATALIEELAGLYGIKIVGSPLRAVIGIVLGRVKARLRLVPGIPEPIRVVDVAPAVLERLEVLRTAGIVFTGIDPVRATYFQIQYILNAITARHPVHLSAALGIEASMRVATGHRTTTSIARLMEAAERIAKASGSPSAMGLHYLCRTYIDYMVGRISSGIAHAETASEILRERCTGAAWELTSVYVLWLWFIVNSGQLTKARAVIPELLKEGAGRGDVNAEVSLRLLTCNHWCYLSVDQPGEAFNEYNRVLERWSNKGFHLQHCTARWSRVEIYLYMGQYASAREELLQGWDRLSHSFILRWQILNITALFLRGRVALACWLENRSDRLLRTELERYLKRLQRIRSGWSSPMVAVLRAGLAIGVGDRAGAIRQLESAYEGFEKVTLHAHAAAARDVCGSIRNDELGQRLREQAAAFFKSQEVRDPAAFTRMLMPGRWTC